MTTRSHWWRQVATKATNGSYFTLTADALPRFPQSVDQTKKERAKSFSLFNARRLDDLIREINDMEYEMNYKFYKLLLHHLLKGTRPRNFLAEAIWRYAPLNKYLEYMLENTNTIFICVHT